MTVPRCQIPGDSRVTATETGLSPVRAYNCPADHLRRSKGTNLMRRPRRLGLTLTACGLFLASSAAAGTALAGRTTPAAAVHPVDARTAILRAFDRYEVAGGMSPAHGVRDVDDFLLDLIRDPRLPGRVNDIAVECGNSRYQPILDSYLAGGDVPLSQVQRVWRDTTQPN